MEAYAACRRTSSSGGAASSGLPLSFAGQVEMVDMGPNSTAMTAPGSLGPTRMHEHVRRRGHHHHRLSSGDELGQQSGAYLSSVGHGSWRGRNGGSGNGGFSSGPESTTGPPATEVRANTNTKNQKPTYLMPTIQTSQSSNLSQETAGEREVA